MTPAAGAQAWQYAAVALAVAGSAIALACHLSPAARAWLLRIAARPLRHRRLPAPLRALGGRMQAAARPEACDPGCGPCAGCGAGGAPRASESTIAPPRPRRHS